MHAALSQEQIVEVQIPLHLLEKADEAASEAKVSIEQVVLQAVNEAVLARKPERGRQHFCKSILHFFSTR